MKLASVRIALPLLLLVLCGCSVTHHVTAPYLPVVAAPAPNSPVNAVRLFEWGWDNRDLGVIRGLLTDDFRFVFAAGDSAGNRYRHDPFGRDDMLLALAHLFDGGGDAAPAASIELTLDATLDPMDDDRPGKNPRWHRQIATSVKLEITTEDEAEYRVTGNATFFLVRGDSAAIPAELGLAPDSTRWYLERWEDYTLGSTAVLTTASPQPAGNTYWGTILALYRD